MSDSDSVTRFLNEKVIVGDSVSVKDLWEAWETWRMRNGGRPISRSAFNERVEKLAYQSNDHKARVWRGISFKNSTNSTLDVNIVNDFLSINQGHKGLWSTRYRKKPLTSLSEAAFSSFWANPLRVSYPVCQKSDCIMKGRKFETQVAYSEHERLIHKGGLKVSEPN